MHKTTLIVMGLLGCAVFFATPALAAQCQKDSVQVGNVCVDLYEASVWEIPAGNTRLINKVKKGTATLSTPSGPAALLRGGSFFSGADAGVFDVIGLGQPSGASDSVGFRCAR